MKTILISILFAALGLASGCAFDPDSFRVESSVPSSLIPAIVSGMELANIDTGHHFRLDDSGDSSVTIAQLPPFTLGSQKDSRLETGYVYRHKVTFDIRFVRYPVNVVSLPSVSAHEFGHAAGLGHVCDPANYMHDQEVCEQ